MIACVEDAADVYVCSMRCVLSPEIKKKIGDEIVTFSPVVNERCLCAL